MHHLPWQPLMHSHNQAGLKLHLDRPALLWLRAVAAALMQEEPHSPPLSTGCRRSPSEDAAEARCWGLGAGSVGYLAEWRKLSPSGFSDLSLCLEVTQLWPDLRRGRSQSQPVGHYPESQRGRKNLCHGPSAPWSPPTSQEWHGTFTKPVVVWGCRTSAPRSWREPV